VGFILFVVRKTATVCSHKTVSWTAAGMLFALLLTGSALSQTETDKPVPILTGNIGTFSFVTGGQNVIDTQLNPVLLVPLGDKWLIESRARKAEVPTVVLSISTSTTHRSTTLRIDMSR